MPMLVVLVVHVFVTMLDGFVHVKVIMLFRKMEEDSYRHEDGRDNQGDAHVFVQEDYRYDGAHKRGN